MNAAPDQKDEGRNDRRAGGSVTTIAADTDSAPRAGHMVRATSSRSVRCACLGCPAEFDNTGAAASHARARRHAVHVDYSTTFTFVPAELLARALADQVGREAQAVAS